MNPVDAVTRTDCRVPPSRSERIGVPVLSEPPVISSLYPASVWSPSPTEDSIDDIADFSFLGIGWRLFPLPLGCGSVSVVGFVSLTTATNVVSAAVINS